MKFLLFIFLFAICLKESFANLCEEFQILNSNITYFRENEKISDSIVINENKDCNYYINTKNKNEYTKDTLIVLVNSNFDNNKLLFSVLLSLLNQSINNQSYQIFLSVSTDDFINIKEDIIPELRVLIENNWVKYLNKYSKYSIDILIDILSLYPENDLLIVNDKIPRTYNFIKSFLEDHNKNPDDIICGKFTYFINDKMELKILDGKENKKGEIMNIIPNIIFQSAIPSIGEGGVYYPKKTFTNTNFFDREKYKTLSKDFDKEWMFNLWLFTFNIIENKILRQTSFIIDYPMINDNSENSNNIKLDEVQNDINSINKEIIQNFPEYETNILQRQKKIIISITSYKERMKNLPLIFESIFNNTMLPSKLVLTLYQDDVQYINKDLQELIDNNKVELIVTDTDYRSHKKYFAVMQKYRDYAIITTDDDIVYTTDFVKSLYNSYMKYPNSISGRRAHRMRKNKGKLLSFKKWSFSCRKIKVPSYELLVTTGSGVIYPPNILNISDDIKESMKLCMTADDIFLNYLGNKQNVKTVYVPNNNRFGLYMLNDEETQKKALRKLNNGKQDLNNVCIKKIKLNEVLHF